MRRECLTERVWQPRNLPSKMMLHNHDQEQSKRLVKPRTRHDNEPEPKVIRNPEIKIRRENEVMIGHGDGVTRWKGCLFTGLKN